MHNVHATRKTLTNLRAKYAGTSTPIPDGQVLQTLEVLHSDVNDAINRRAALAAALERCAEGDEVGIIIDSIDCDRTRGHYEWIVYTSEVREQIEDIMADREGPTSWYLCKPSEIRARRNA